MDTDLQSLFRPLMFTIFTIINVMFSWVPLQNLRAHGFYRFFAFEGTLVLALINGAMGPTFTPDILQDISQIMKIASIIFVIFGFMWLVRYGGNSKRDGFPENKRFENTTILVTTGIYRYIRHPMYSSVLLIGWGLYLGYPTLTGTPIILMASVAMLLAVKVEERENIAYFGDEYVEYMKRTKRFLPFIL